MTFPGGSSLPFRGATLAVGAKKLARRGAALNHQRRMDGGVEPSEKFISII